MTMVVFWRLSGEKACDALLKGILERIQDVWNESKCHPTDSGDLPPWPTLLSSLIFASHGSVERETHQRASGAVPAASCHFSGRVSVSSGSSCC